MRSIQVTELLGPESVRVLEVPDLEPVPGEVLIEVRAMGVCWPDLLLSKGQYQLKPDVPFQLGADIAGVVRSAPAESGYTVGDEVVALMPFGGGADLVSVAPEATYKLPSRTDFTCAAAIPGNYMTAEFALSTRAGLAEGETLLVTGAAGGVGTAAVQLAKGRGATVIAVVSTPEKADFALSAGADHAVLTEGFLPQVKELTDGRGVDVVLDVVGEPLMTDLLRSLTPLGRLLIVGFTGGQIPQVRVNRLLLNNIDIRGVGLGAYTKSHPGYRQRLWSRLLQMIESGAIDPPIGRTYEVAAVRDALIDLDERRSLGKTVLKF